MFLSSQPSVVFQMNENLKYRLTYVFAIVAFLAIAKFSPEWRENRTLDFLADISYSLYVTHLVIGTTVVLMGLQLGAPPALATTLALAVIILVGWALHVTVEKPSHRLGRKWSHLVSQNVVKTAAPEHVNRMEEPVTDAAD
jgi:peptidoglycan/LPS O-acetylase OafA/YrhL